MAITFRQLREENRHNLPQNSTDSINVNLPERMVSVFGGTLLGLNAIKNMFGSPLFALTEATVAGLLLYRGVTGNCPVYRRLGRDTNKVEAVNIRQTIVVNKPRNEVYQFWRKLENLPVFMNHLEDVYQTDSKHSHWVARIPGNMGKISWNAEIVKEKEDNFIGWRSVKGSAINNAGKVEFTDSPSGGTEIQAVISYHAPAGGFGTSVAKLINPVFEKIIREDILNFKHYIEVGEIPVTAQFMNRMD
ncbi:YgaP-like transmembrane domain [Rubrolithibacter danxiaensis]|uniref:YgaP-like transmembrane domain n=1 Tax=Rubrolithibacter danxiaensis TaxID=3390805 RepID=UPI003BF8E197